MPEAKTQFRQALGSIIAATSRETNRQPARRREHLLLGALTKRPA